MELNELIAAVKAAKDKAELEALVKAELQIDLDRRKSLETLRGEVLKGLGADAGESGGDEPQKEKAPEQAEPPAQGGEEQDAELQRLREENAELRSDNDALLAELQSAQLQLNNLQAGERVSCGVAGSVTGDGEITLPELDDEPTASIALPGGPRLLRNTENGRDFAWTPELARLPNMKEL
ncbi:hypothetical protein ACYCFK_17835 [Stutzerimonas stutzeri]